MLRFASAALLVAAMRLSFTCASPGATLMWCGAVTNTSAAFRVAVDAGDTFVVSTQPDLVTGAQSFPLTAGVQGVQVNGLLPRTQYYYGVQSKPADVGRFRTFASSRQSLRIAFASCAETGSQNGIFHFIRDLQPDLFVHMGDMFYSDISVNSTDRFAREYQRLHSTIQVRGTQPACVSRTAASLGARTGGHVSRDAHGVRVG